ncbi:hypothetical protein V2J56_09170 [Georgenia sp. MJ206]|uniref:hypothetical protein n=1 Tax=Georgenia wangjunii TaxID=3117730 RepID=UPI002F26D7C1
MSYALATDVATTLGRPLADFDSDEMNQVNRWIKGAELLIRLRLGDLAALDVEALNYVIAEVVARRVRNPEGKQNERIDDYSYGLNPEAARAELHITDAEWAMLTPVREAGAFTIRMSGTPGYATGRGW